MFKLLQQGGMVQLQACTANTQIINNMLDILAQMTSTMPWTNTMTDPHVSVLKLHSSFNANTAHLDS